MKQKIPNFCWRKKKASNGFLTVLTLPNFNTKEHRNTILGVELLQVKYVRLRMNNGDPNSTTNCFVTSLQWKWELECKLRMLASLEM
jgi:hypothetical protein